MRMMNTIHSVATRSVTFVTSSPATKVVLNRRHTWTSLSELGLRHHPLFIEASITGAQLRRKWRETQKMNLLGNS